MPMKICYRAITAVMSEDVIAKRDETIMNLIGISAAKLHCI